MTLWCGIQGLHTSTHTAFCFTVNKCCTSSLNCRPPLAATHHYTNNAFQGQRKIPPTSIWLVHVTNLTRWLEAWTSIQWRIRKYKVGKRRRWETWVNACVFSALCAQCVVCSLSSVLSRFSGTTAKTSVYIQSRLPSSLLEAFGLKAKVSCKC